MNKMWDSFTKIAVMFMLINSTVWMYLSYYLAYLGRTQIAENLSEKVVIEILGVILVYSLKAGVENISKNNNWPDKIIKPNITRDC